LEKAINKFSVPSAKLAEAFERVKLCIASDRGENAVFKCAYLSIDEEGSQADIVSTDKRRVGYYRLPKEDGLKSKGGKITALIPEFIVSNILPLLKNYNLDVQIAVNDKTIEFTFANGFVITSRLVDGKFPEWNKLISLNMNEHSITVIKNDLLNALKRCEGVLKDNIVKIEFDEKNITITGAEADRGSCEEHVDIINKDKFKNSYFYNLVYLMDGLKVASTDEVVLRVSESNKPLGVKELHGNENYIYAMMAITSK
jgi:DNA polymerase-3 subunit beta